ncbi:hypothetical protein SKAU_G00303750, partial [Synaphobranchus kaupii]
VSTGQPRSSVPPIHPTALWGTELLKSELTRRDATIRKLRQDVLHSHQARDSQSAQLDAQEQRISQLHRELQESQQELQRGHGRTQQLHRDLSTTEKQAEELRAQLSEVKGQLVHVEAENEAHRTYKLEQRAEVDRLGAELCSLQAVERERGSEETAQVERRCEELDRELREARAQLTHCQETAHSADQRAEEQLRQLQTEMSSLKAQHSFASQQTDSVECHVYACLSHTGTHALSPSPAATPAETRPGGVGGWGFSQRRFWNEMAASREPAPGL